MPSQTSSTDTTPDASRATGHESPAPGRSCADAARTMAERTADTHDAASVAARALAADTLAGDLAREVIFWRARAEELAQRLGRLEERLEALGARLPARWAQLLVCDPAELPERVGYAPDPLAGWRETTDLEPARVAAALPRLWDRLEPGAS